MSATNQVVIEDDLLQHIQDTDLFTVWRDMRPYKVSWNQMSEQERAAIRQERVYDYYCRVNYLGMYENWYK